MNLWIYFEKFEYIVLIHLFLDMLAYKQKIDKDIIRLYDTCVCF